MDKTTGYLYLPTRTITKAPKIYFDSPKAFNLMHI